MTQKQILRGSSLRSEPHQDDKRYRDPSLPVADRVMVLDEGRAIASGRPEEIRRNPAVISAYLGRRAGLA